jgi:hypothetical protein
MVEQILERNCISQFGGFNFVSSQARPAAVHRAAHARIPWCVLAPALTASAVSLEQSRRWTC